MRLTCQKIWDEIQSQLKIKNVHIQPGHITNYRCHNY